MDQAPDNLSPHRHWPKELLGGAIIIAVAGLIGLIIKLQSHQPAIQHNTISTITSTPETYEDFIGTVTAVDGQTIKVHFIGTSSSGQSFTKNFDVTIDQSTKIQKWQADHDDRKLVPATLSQISVGTTIFAASAVNVAEISSFTATNINIY